MRCIDETHMEYPFMGSRRVVFELADKGHHVNRKKVQRLMILMRIYAVYPMKKTTSPDIRHKIYPYLLRNLDVKFANHVWATDITYSVPGVQGKHGCLNEPRVYLKYANKTLRTEVFASMPSCAGM